MVEWLFDLGNTRLKCAPLRTDGGVGEGFAVAHDGRALPADWLQRLPTRIDAVMLASVAAPALRVALLSALAGRCGRVVRVATPHRFGDLRIAYAVPQRLGVDRFLALLGARTRVPDAACLVVGVGTATTIDLLDAAGVHRGGRIAPSPALMRESLHRRAPHLPATGGHYRAFADDTDDALASGCEGAVRALVAASVDDACRLLGASPRVFVHGGGAEAILAGVPRAESSPHLVLEGLARWATALRAAPAPDASAPDAAVGRAP